MFVNLTEMLQTGKFRLACVRNLRVVSLVLIPSAFLLLGVLLGSIYPDTRPLIADCLTGPHWVEVDLPSLPALARHKAVIIEAESGEILCVIGGDSKQVYCYPLRATGEPDGSGGPAYSLNKDVRFHAATTVGNRVYVLGGLAGSDILESVHCARRNTDGSWDSGNAGSMKKKTMQHAALTVNNRIYVIGGFDDGWNYLAEVWSADARTGCTSFDKDDWRQEKSLRTNGGNLHKVSGHAAVSAEVNGKTYIYVIGGMAANNNPTNVVLRAEVGSSGILSDWTDLGAVNGMPGTWLLTAAVSGRYLYVLGGTPSRTAATSSAKVFRAEIEGTGGLTWLPSPSDLPVPLHAHASAVSKPGRLYVVGGISKDVLQDKAYFTPLLDFEKRANTRGPVTYGDAISYTLTLANLCVRDLLNLTITDTVDSDTAALFEFSNLPVGCQVYSGDTITCTVPSLVLGNTKDLDFGVTISQPTTSLFSTFNSGNLMPNCDADLRLEKSSDQALVVAGQILSYTLRVHNDGPSEAQNVTVTDYLPDGVTLKSATPSPSSTNPLMWSWSSIPDNRSRTIRLVVQVDPGASGTLTNTAIVSSSSTSDPVPGNNQAEAWTVVVKQADLRIEKIDSTDPITPGETLTYTLIVTNEGPSNAQVVPVSDYLPPNLEIVATTPPTISGPSPLAWHLNVPAGQGEEIQIVATVDPDSRGVMRNVAIVSSDIDTDRSNDVDEEWTAIDSLADLWIEKISDPVPVVSAGGVLTYTLWITNEGPSEARRVIVTDTLPLGVCGLVSSPPHCSGNPLRCDLGTVSAGEHEPIQILATVCPSSTGILLNRAEVRSDVPDSTPWNNEDQVQTAIGTLADLHLEKSRYPDLAIAGDTLTYTLEVVNDGPSDASSMVVTDILPAGTRFITATPPVIWHSGVVTWHIPTLLADQSKELQLVVRVNSGNTDGLTNTAFVTSSTPDDDPADNKAEDWTRVYAVADLSIGKEANLDRVVGGGKLVYTLQITNTGPSDAPNVRVYDTLPTSVTLRSSAPPPTSSSPSLLTWDMGTLAAGDGRTIVLTTTVDSSARGLLINTATVNGGVPDPDLSNYHDEEQTLAPVVVTNTAYICEDGRWCKESNPVVIYPCNVYLPVILKVSS